MINWIAVICLYFVVPIILMMIGALTHSLPPRKINMLYGYRSPMSMKNQDTWDFAQDFFNNKIAILGVIQALLGVFAILASYILLPAHIMLVAYIGCGLEVASIIVLGLVTEHQLNQYFNKDGTTKE